MLRLDSISSCVVDTFHKEARRRIDVLGAPTVSGGRKLISRQVFVQSN